MEIWKEIKDYTGYEVSDQGNIRHATRSCKEYIDKAGYKKAWLYNGNKRKYYSVHRLVLIAFVPPADAILEVNHIDCDKSNNKLSNLEWVTRAENMKHALDNGRMDFKYRKGQDSPNYGKVIPEDIKDKMRKAHNKNGDHPNYKLTEQQVVDIKKRRHDGASLESLSIEYNQAIANISLIVRGRRRASIAPEYTQRKFKRVNK